MGQTPAAVVQRPPCSSGSVSLGDQQALGAPRLDAVPVKRWASPPLAGCPLGVSLGQPCVDALQRILYEGGSPRPAALWARRYPATTILNWDGCALGDGPAPAPKLPVCSGGGGGLQAQTEQDRPSGTGSSRPGSPLRRHIYTLSTMRFLARWVPAADTRHPTPRPVGKSAASFLPDVGPGGRRVFLKMTVTFFF